VVVFGATTVKGEFGVFTDRGRQFIETLEAECTKTGLRLHMYAATPRAFAMFQKKKSNLMELGYIIYPGEWFGKPDTRKQIEGILFQLSLNNKPIAIMDEMGGYQLPKNFPGSGDVKIYTISAELAGIQVAEYLMKQGHEKTAFISPYQKLYWSYKRYEGMRSGCKGAGPRAKVIPFVLDQLGRKYNLMVELGGINTGAIKKIKRSIQDKEKAEQQIFQMFLHHTEKLFTDTIRSKTKSPTRGKPGKSTPLKQGAYSDLHQKLKYDILDRMIDEEVSKLLEPLFHQALQDDRITAWVAANDRTAIAALKFLHNMQKRVPEDISVIGFDNSQESFDHGLTSYHFNVPQFAHQMLEFILKPRKRVGRVGKSVQVIEGMIIERQTTARVSGRPRIHQNVRP
jgi:DNA-binding LacI/PurR family transcriptional regulator